MQSRPAPSDYNDRDHEADIIRLEKRLQDLLDSVEAVPYATPAADPPPAGLLTYWATIRSRKFLVLGIGAAVALAAWYVSNRAPRRYEASTTLEILEPNRGSLNMQNFDNREGRIDQETYMQTQIRLLGSKALLNRVGQRLLEEKVIRPSDLPGNAQSAEAQSDPVLSLSNISVTPVRGARIVTVSYSAKEPALAARIANSLAAEYIQQDVDTRVDTAEQTLAWLEKQLRTTKERLEESEARLHQYAKLSGLLFTSPKGAPAEDAEEKLQFLAHSLAEAQAKGAGLEAKYETLAKAKQEEADSAALTEIQGRLLELRRQRAALGAQYTSEYSQVKQLDAQIAALQEGSINEYNRWLSQLSAAYRTEVAHKRLLEEAYKQQTAVVSDQKEKAIGYNVLKREVETNRTLYDALLSGMKTAGVNASARVHNARVIDPAEPPRRPFSPRPLRMAAVGLIAGLMMGAALVLVIKTGDRRVRMPGSAQAYLNVPELGVIPSTKAHLLPSARYATNGVVRAGAWSRLLRHRAHQNVAVFEAFHSVVTSILSPARAAYGPRVLVVTSGALHEGKSTVIGNLALMAAQIGLRVVLVDGDLRNPRLSKIYPVPNEIGLGDLLMHSQPLEDEAFFAAIQNTGMPGLWLLPSGSVDGGIATMLHSPRMPEVVSRLRTEFDLVLIDTPPVLPFPDARVFGKVADAVVLVVRAGRTTRDIAMAAKARLVEDGLPVIGTVLNDWDGKEAPYDYGRDRAYRS